MALQDGGVPAFLFGPFGAIGKVRQCAFFDHTVQGLVGNIHLFHHLWHTDKYFFPFHIEPHFSLN
jgi:hypothetical protein